MFRTDNVEHTKFVDALEEMTQERAADAGRQKCVDSVHSRVSFAEEQYYENVGLFCERDKIINHRAC